MDRHRWWEWLFVYGTLRPDARHVLGRWLEGSCVYGGQGRVRGTLYDLGFYPGMVVGATTEGWVVGELFRFRDWPLGLGVLDWYEGGEYERVRVEVFCFGGTTEGLEEHGSFRGTTEGTEEHGSFRGTTEDTEGHGRFGGTTEGAEEHGRILGTLEGAEGHGIFRGGVSGGAWAFVLRGEEGWGRRCRRIKSGDWLRDGDG